jgi:hypothetical protein
MITIGFKAITSVLSVGPNDAKHSELSFRSVLIFEFCFSRRDYPLTLYSQLGV